MDDLINFLNDRLDEDEDDPYCEGIGEYLGCHKWSARHLREVEAKRRILRELCLTPRWKGELVGALSEVVATLLALPYSDHPDYQEEWK